jgi:hypothetical protein
MLALAASLLVVACGKKGPPVAPRLRIPAAVDKITATRLGNEVFVSLMVPDMNIDKSMPVDISRIEVYGYTGRIAPTPARWVELGTLVATIPVVAPKEDEQGNPLPLLPPPSGDALPATSVTVLDVLSADEFVQGEVYVDPRESALPTPTLQTPATSILRRFYRAVPFSERGRPGPPGAQAEFVLTQVPDPPSDVRAAYNAGGIFLSWEPSGGLLGFLLDRALPPEPAPFVAAPVPAALAAVPDTAVPPGPTTYNVYRDVAPDPDVLPLAAARPPWSAPVPAPINPSALATTSASDEAAFGRTHCYAVRAQRGSVMSGPSPATCLTPIDVFPPAPPVGLAAVPSEGGISLIWEPNSEIDLGGYLVLRGEPGDATLRQLTHTPVVEARYRDTDVRPGTRYVYAVVALDTQLPLPNASDVSERVEETAR